MHDCSWIAWFYWNPPREAFTIPFFDHPVVWYGILFVTGFIAAYFLLIPIFDRLLSQYPLSSLATLQHAIDKPMASTRQMAFFLTDRLCWFAVIGTIVGARLGLVFFYDWPYFRQHPTEIFKVWHGGLASHGGFAGVMIALYFYTKYVQKWIPQLTFLRLLDCVAIPTAFVCVFIRLGNFFNQEILGTPTSLPWGVIFGHPADSSAPFPRHPVQLYEAGAYLLTFCILWILWKYRHLDEKPGALIGLTFILGFGSRFILEFWKETQDSSMVDSSFLQMGQILSIPFILLGTYLFWRSIHSNGSSSPSLEIRP